jgi:hypothetical protein
MSVARLTLVAMLLAGCASGEVAEVTSARLDATGAILPDTQTVDGVLVMRHGPDAFERAPQWFVDSLPAVVIDGGESFDLTWIMAPTPLPDGQYLLLNRNRGGQLMLFGTDGAPLRLLARTGEGPGELMNPAQPSILGDTIVVADGANSTVNWYQADRGLLQSERNTQVALNDPGCWAHLGAAPDGRRLSLYGCYGADSARRRPNPVAWIPPDFSRVDTVLFTGGIEMVPREIMSGGRAITVHSPLGLGLRPVAAPWGSGIAVGNGGLHRDLERQDDVGQLTGRVTIARPLRAVTAAMREALIAAEIDQLEVMGPDIVRDPEGARRHIREQPFADSLPAYRSLLQGADGVIWAIDGTSDADSSWSATIFRDDGAILARVHGVKPGLPVRVMGDRVVVRETDEDGVVRFGVYRVGPR